MNQYACSRCTAGCIAVSKEKDCEICYLRREILRLQAELQRVHLTKKEKPATVHTVQKVVYIEKEKPHGEFWEDEYGYQYGDIIPY
jgi:hypothetical protein